MTPENVGANNHLPSQRAFEAEVRRRLKERAGVARDARGEVRAALRAALAEIDAMLAEQPADWKTWHLAKLREQVTAALGKGSEAASAAVQRALERAAALGEQFAPAALAAAGVSGVGAPAPLLTNDLVEQLGRFCRLRLVDVGEQAAAAIGSELTQVVLGSKTPFEGMRAIHALLGDKSRAMMRAERIINTEVGRAFASAQQAGMERAAESVPGLKKQWRRSGKLHSRAEHDFMDGKVVDVDEKFHVPMRGGGTTPMLYPHDPAAPAAQVINCGCVCLPWMEEWQVMHPGAKPFTKKEIEAQPEKAGRPPGAAWRRKWKKGDKASRAKGQQNWRSLGLAALQGKAETAMPALPQLEAGKTRADALDIFRAHLGMERGGTLPVDTPAGRVTLKDGLLFHAVEGEKHMRERYAAYLMPTLTQPDEVWRTDYDDGTSRLSYIKLFKKGGDSSTFFGFAAIVHEGLEAESVFYNMMKVRYGSVGSMRTGQRLFAAR